MAPCKNYVSQREVPRGIGAEFDKVMAFGAMVRQLRKSA
jgi:hypothetical protein